MDYRAIGGTGVARVFVVRHPAVAAAIIGPRDAASRAGERGDQEPRP